MTDQIAYSVLFLRNEHNMYQAKEDSQRIKVYSQLRRRLNNPAATVIYNIYIRLTSSPSQTAVTS